MHGSAPSPHGAVRVTPRLGRLGALWLALAAAACSEEAEERAADAVPAPEARIALHRIDHLDARDRTPPEQWLASREAGREVREDDPSVAAIRRTLETASRRFRDYPRMIANRAVQLEEMLKERNLPEPAPDLIARLSEVPGDVRHVESFGALCQQYYNLRMQGLDRQQAMQFLRSGAQTPD